jgi:myo-inositol-1(or 4)-monophosphatase
MHPFLNTAIKAALAAADVIQKGYRRLDLIKISQKGPKDFVTNIDMAAERRIIEIINTAYPQHSILSEESGSSKKTSSPYQWIIDPLDGTTNFLHGFPHFAVSIGLKHKDRIEHGVIYDPLRDDLFTASCGGGAQKNSRRIRVGNRVKLSNSLIVSGLPARAERYYEAHCKIIKTLAPLVGSLRSTGSAALDLAYIASGQIDGFWAVDLKIWDLAAGALIVKEAGGHVTDCQGKENYLESGCVVAGNIKILKQLLPTVQANLSELHHSST